MLTGGADVLDMAVFDTSVFSRGATFSSFDFMDMISKDSVQAAALLRRGLRYYRDGHLRPLRANETFDIAELGSAVKMVSRGTCFRKVLVTCGPKSIVPVSLLVQDPHKEPSNSPHAFRCNLHTIH